MTILPSSVAEKLAKNDQDVFCAGLARSGEGNDQIQKRVTKNQENQPSHIIVTRSVGLSSEAMIMRQGLILSTSGSATYPVLPSTVTVTFSDQLSASGSAVVSISYY